MIEGYFLRGLLIGLKFGVTIISDFLTAHQFIIRVIGGALILTLGISVLRKKEMPCHDFIIMIFQGFAIIGFQS